MKIVRVLCTDKTDYLHLLAASASLTGLTAAQYPSVCVIDRQTMSFASASGFRLADWADEVVVVEAPYASPLLNSRYLKTTLRFHVAGEFLFLDLDAVVVREELFWRLKCDCIAAGQNIDHNNLRNRNDRFTEDIGTTIYGPMGWEYPFLPYVNSGVLYCRDNAHCRALFERWHQLWEDQRQRLGFHLDQPPLNQALREIPDCLTLMPPVFNSPVDVGPEFEANAWVFHYYISIYADKPRADSLLGIVSREIQSHGRMNQAILRFLLGQKRAFFPELSYGTDRPGERESRREAPLPVHSNRVQTVVPQNSWLT